MFLIKSSNGWIHVDNLMNNECHTLNDFVYLYRIH